MCGIWVSIRSKEQSDTQPSDECACLLQRRGPDSQRVHKHHPITFLSTVLSLRGDDNGVHAQPLVDDNQSVLCWNGEAWKIAGEEVRGNDTEVVFGLFLRAVSSSSSSLLECGGNHTTTAADDRGGHDTGQATTIRRFSRAIGTISGPFAFVFYDALHSLLFYGRDCLGRRSLLHRYDDGNNLTICSVCDGDDFEEIDGLHVVDLSSNNHDHTCIPWTRPGEEEEDDDDDEGFALVRVYAKKKKKSKSKNC